MITTKDIKTKDVKEEKLTILTTGKHKPQEFIPKGNPKPRDKRMITTSNVEQFQRERLLSEEKLAKKARKDKAEAEKKAKAEAKAEKDKKK